jgi:peptide/nickel transport system substrate-binding protein
MRVSGLAVVVALLLTTYGCGNGHVKQRDATTIRFATGQPLQTFDPHMADTGPVFSTYLTLVYDGLTARNPDDMWQPLPGLAHSWHWLDDKTIDFYLVENVRFSDGVAFDASVAKANIERMLAVKGPRVNTMATIRSAEVIDSNTFRIHLHQPDPTLTQNLAGSPGMMISPEAFGNPDLDLNPVGTGPWRYDIENSALGEVHRFVPKTNHFDPLVQTDSNIQVHVLTNARARLNALISGQVDIALVSALEAKPAKDVGFAIAQRANRWFGMTILDRNGELVPELADPRVRQALGFAVDRQALADALFFGYARPASQPMVEDVGYVPELSDFYRYDPVYARQLLDEAGVDEFSFTLPCYPDASKEYEAVQHYLRQVGINMEIEVIEPGTIAALARTRQYPVNTITFPNFGPDSRHPAIWETTAVFNPFRVEGARINELATAARVSMDDELRQRNYREYFEIIVRDVYSLIYLQIEDLVAYDSDKLKEVQVGGFIDPVLRNIRLAPIAESAL